MSKCSNSDTGKLLDLYLHDLLSAEETEKFERHLLECDYCAGETERYNEVSVKLLTSSKLQAGIEAIVSDRSDSKSGEEDSPEAITPGFWKRYRLVWAAAAIIIILLLKPWNIEFRSTDEAIAGENRIAILPINVLEGNEDWLGEAATNLLITGLSESDQLAILTSQRISNVLEYMDMKGIISFDANSAVSIAKEADADWVIIGTIGQAEPVLSLSLVLLNASSGDTVATESITGNGISEIFKIIDGMADTVKASILSSRRTIKSQGRSLADITTRSPDAYRHYIKGVSLFEQLYYDEARESFFNAVSYDSTFAMAYYYLSKLVDSKYTDSALKYIDRSSRWEQYYIRAQAALIDSDSAGFFLTLRKLMEDFPFDAKAPNWYAQIKKSYGDTLEALNYYYRAVEIDPYYKQAYNGMTYIYLNAENYEKAIWACDMYIAIAPDEANPYDTRGDIYMQMGDFEKAIDSYLMALNRKPCFDYTYSKLCMLYTLARDFEQAESWYDICWPAEHEEPFPANISAEMLISQGKFEKAIRILDERLSMIADGVVTINSAAELILKKAEILAELNPAMAIQELEKISVSVDSLADYHKLDYRFLYTNLLADLNLFAGADSSAEELLSHSDSSEQYQHRYHLAKGHIKFKQGLTEEALSLYRQACEYKRSKDDFIGRYLLALAYLESGQPDQTVIELTQQLNYAHYERIKYSPQDAKIHYYLGRAYEDLLDNESAIEQYEHFLEIWSEADIQIAEIEDTKRRLTKLKSRL